MKPSVVGATKSVAILRDHGPRGLDQFPREPIGPATQRLRGEREIAHQALDHVAPDLVLFGKFDAADDRQSLAVDKAPILRDGGFILDIASRKTADRGRAEPDQRVRRDRPYSPGNSAAPFPRARRPRAGRRAAQMIDADPFETGGQKSVAGHLRQPVPLQRSWQVILGNERLMPLHPGHMGVAEQRESVGGQRDHLVERARELGRVLPRQAIDRVDIERARARARHASIRAGTPRALRGD